MQRARHRHAAPARITGPKTPRRRAAAAVSATQGAAPVWRQIATSAYRYRNMKSLAHQALRWRLSGLSRLTGCLSWIFEHAGERKLPKTATSFSCALQHNAYDTARHGARIQLFNFYPNRESRGLFRCNPGRDSFRDPGNNVIVSVHRPSEGCGGSGIAFSPVPRCTQQ